MNFRPYVEIQYRGGWVIQQTWRTSLDRPGPDGYDRVAVRGQVRIEQGDRTFEKFLDGLDRIDGRKVLADFLTGLHAGKTSAQASIPVPFGPDGEPLAERSSAAPPVPAAAPIPACKAPGTPVQPSLFGDLL